MLGSEKEKRNLRKNQLSGGLPAQKRFKVCRGPELPFKPSMPRALLGWELN